jgi:hypothetical protein
MFPDAQTPNDGSTTPKAKPAAPAALSGKAPAARTLSPAVLAKAKKIGRRPIWARPYTSGRTRALWLQTFLAITVLAGLGLMASDLLAAGLARSVAFGAEVTQERKDLTLAVWGLTAIMATATMVTSFVLLLVWLHRAYRNLPALGARYVGDSPAWAVGSFFIPLANLVMPVLIVGTIWRGSELQHDAGVRRSGRRPSVPPLVLVWWVLWVLSGMARVGMNLAGKRAATGEELLRVAWHAFSVHGLTVVAFVLTFVVVRTIQNLQDKKWASLCATTELG